MQTLLASTMVDFSLRWCISCLPAPHKDIFLHPSLLAAGATHKAKVLKNLVSSEISVGERGVLGIVVC